jgi:hypothetical protein
MTLVKIEDLSGKFYQTNMMDRSQLIRRRSSTNKRNKFRMETISLSDYKHRVIWREYLGSQKGGIADITKNRSRTVTSKTNEEAMYLGELKQAGLLRSKL